MTMHRLFGSYIYECDGCGEELDTDETEFDDAHRRREAADWQAKKDDSGEWVHYCPACKGDVWG